MRNPSGTLFFQGSNTSYAPSNNFREYVSSYWPNPGTKGSQVQSMYDRLAAIDSGSAEKEAGSSAEGSRANGKTNGVAIKQE